MNNENSRPNENNFYQNVNTKSKSLLSKNMMKLIALCTLLMFLSTFSGVALANKLSPIAVNKVESFNNKNRNNNFESKKTSQGNNLKNKNGEFKTNRK